MGRIPIEEKGKGGNKGKHSRFPTPKWKSQSFFAYVPSPPRMGSALANRLPLHFPLDPLFGGKCDRGPNTMARKLCDLADYFQEQQKKFANLWRRTNKLTYRALEIRTVCISFIRPCWTNSTLGLWKTKYLLDPLLRAPEGTRFFSLSVGQPLYFQIL